MTRIKKLVDSIFITEDDFQEIESDLIKITDWQEKLLNINVENVQPIFNTIDNFSEKYLYFNDGEVKKDENINILSNAAKSYDNYFLVPKIIKK